MPRWSVFTLLSCFVFLGAGIWTWIETPHVKDNMNCILDDLYFLGTNTDPAVPAGAVVADNFNEDAVSKMRDVSKNLELVAIAPAVCSLIFMTMTLFCAALGRCKNVGCCFPWAKFFLFWSELAVIVSLVFYGIFLGAAIASDIDKVKSEWEKTTEVCPDNRADISLQLVQARVSLTAEQARCALEPAGSPSRLDCDNNVATLTANLELAEEQFGHFTSLCVCAGNTLEAVKPLLGPGAMGVAASLLAFISINALCCTMGCCCRRPERDLDEANGHIGYGGYGGEKQSTPVIGAYSSSA